MKNWRPYLRSLFFVTENLWTRVSEMVSFYGADMSKEDVKLPVGSDCTLSPIRDTPPKDPVKTLVCSPDLPVFEETPSSSSPDAFRCTVCQKTFPTKNTYQNHLRTHTRGDNEDPYPCNICGKTFAVPARLTRHYRTHTGEKPYKCEYCDKSFSVKENLSVHRRIHTKERPYRCDICERAFEHSGKLHRHMRIHTGERPHKCGVCSKTFIQSGQLVIHMRTHTGEKPYVCKVCSKGFTCSKQLKVHTRTHTGEKPYHCDICGKSFGYNHVLKLHQVAHYGEKVYKCTLCNDTFTCKKSMESHIKTHSEPTTQRPISSDLSETSASSLSDKENKDADVVEKITTTNVVEVEAPSVNSSQVMRYYLYYPSNTPQPVHTVLPPMGGVDPALLAAAEAAAASEETEGKLMYETAQLPIEPSIYLCPDPLASIQKRERFVEYYEEEKTQVTPPVSPQSAPSPPPSSPEVVEREYSLPMRKRSKMILKSMEYAEETPPPQFRQSSVIHFARASTMPS